MVEAAAPFRAESGGEGWGTREGGDPAAGKAEDGDGGEEGEQRREERRREGRKAGRGEGGGTPPRRGRSPGKVKGMERVAPPKEVLWQASPGASRCRQPYSAASAGRLPGPGLGGTVRFPRAPRLVRLGRAGEDAAEGPGGPAEAEGAACLHAGDCRRDSLSLHVRPEVRRLASPRISATEESARSCSRPRSCLQQRSSRSEQRRDARWRRSRPAREKPSRRKKTRRESLMEPEGRAPAGGGRGTGEDGREKPKSRRQAGVGEERRTAPRELRAVRIAESKVGSAESVQKNREGEEREKQRRCARLDERRPTGEAREREPRRDCCALLIPDSCQILEVSRGKRANRPVEPRKRGSKSKEEAGGACRSAVNVVVALSAEMRLLVEVNKRSRGSKQSFRQWPLRAHLEEKGGVKQSSWRMSVCGSEGNPLPKR